MTLDLKIPPVLVVALSMLLMGLISRITPGFDGPLVYRGGLFGIFTLLGALCAVGGVMSFVRAKTTVNPLSPDTATALVTSGIYRYTRNPMYLGMLVFLLGWGLFLANVTAIVGSVFFVLYMTRFQIKPEEKALEKIFGQAYRDYCQKVRRWL